MTETRSHIKENDSCDFCNQSIETYEHLFFDCPITNRILKDLLNWMSPNLFTANKINVTNIILGYIDIPCTKTCNIINTIILTFKYYIYRCKCNNTAPSFDNLLVDIKKSYTIEKKYK